MTTIRMVSNSDTIGSGVRQPLHGIVQKMLGTTEISEPYLTVRSEGLEHFDLPALSILVQLSEGVRSTGSAHVLHTQLGEHVPQIDGLVVEVILLGEYVATAQRHHKGPVVALNGGPR